jgi:diaminopimelate decarboxylase
VTDRPEHAPLTQFAIVDDRLIVGGRTPRDLAAIAGGTPFYAYDRAAIGQRLATLRACLPPGLHLHYAVKANPMPAVVEAMRPLVDGFDVASLGELRIALDAGMPGGEISFAGPGKTDRELAGAIAAGITVNLESAGELERAACVGGRLGITPRVAVRVNPDFELKSSGMKMAGGAKPFGIDAEQVPAMLARIGALGCDFRGFHIFSGSQNLRHESLIEAQSLTLELALRLADTAPGPVQLLNIGGGFGIPYFPGEQPLELAPIADNLARSLPGVKARLGDVEVVIELGRYLVGEAGAYFCEVVDRKVSRGRTFLVTNGGLHHHLAASGNFGQVLRKNYPVVAAERVHGGPREEVTVVGPLCTPLDLLADRVELGRCEVGDLITVLQSGAYGYTASPHAFLSHPLPAEILV